MNTTGPGTPNTKDGVEFVLGMTVFTKRYMVKGQPKRYDTTPETHKVMYWDMDWGLGEGARADWVLCDKVHDYDPLPMSRLYSDTPRGRRMLYKDIINDLQKSVGDKVEDISLLTQEMRELREKIQFEKDNDPDSYEPISYTMRLKG